MADYKFMKIRKQHALTVEGHGDERGTDAYNPELGGRLASVVKKYLQDLDPRFKRNNELRQGKARV